MFFLVKGSYNDANFLHVAHYVLVVCPTVVVPTLPPGPCILDTSGALSALAFALSGSENRATVDIVDSSVKISRSVDNAALMVAFAGYHVEAALRYAEHNEKQRFSLLDMSQRLSRGARAFDWDSSDYDPRQVLTHYSLRDRSFPEGARSLVVFNDTNPVAADLLDRSRKRGIPTVSVVEGAVDFGRALNDLEPRPGAHKAKSYRNADHVFLHGYWSRKFFADKPNQVVGSSRAEFFLGKTVRKPSRPSILVNLNFSYGVLTDAANGFLEGCSEAVSGTGLEVRVTQHPRDSTVLPGRLNDLHRRDLVAALQSSSVLVSRFSTVIIDALALGLPVVYFNPHGEPVEELLPPFGAFDIARNSRELSGAINRALQQQTKGKDVRRESSEFLYQHAGLRNGFPTTSQRFGAALQAVVEGVSPAVLSHSGESARPSTSGSRGPVSVAAEKCHPQKGKSWIFFFWYRVRVVVVKRIKR